MRLRISLQDPDGQLHELVSPRDSQADDKHRSSESGSELRLEYSVSADGADQNMSAISNSISDAQPHDQHEQERCADGVVLGGVGPNERADIRPGQANALRQANHFATFEERAINQLKLLQTPFAHRGNLLRAVDALEYLPPEAMRLNYGSQKTAVEAWEKLKIDMCEEFIPKHLKSGEKWTHELAALHFNINTTLTAEDRAGSPYLQIIGKAASEAFEQCARGWTAERWMVQTTQDISKVSREQLLDWLLRGRISPADVEQAFRKQPPEWLTSMARSKQVDPMTLAARQVLRPLCVRAGKRFVGMVDHIADDHGVRRNWNDDVLAKTVRQLASNLELHRQHELVSDEPSPEQGNVDGRLAKLLRKLPELLAPSSFTGRSMDKDQLEQLLAALKWLGAPPACSDHVGSLVKSLQRAEQAKEEEEQRRKLEAASSKRNPLKHIVLPPQADEPPPPPTEPHPDDPLPPPDEPHPDDVGAASPSRLSRVLRGLSLSSPDAGASPGRPRSPSSRLSSLLSPRKGQRQVTPESPS